MQKFLWQLAFIIVLGVALEEGRACDVCGCYTPQIETLPQFAPETVLDSPTSPAGANGLLSHTYFAVVSGEHKDLDRFRGKAAEDTGIISVFVGPRLLVSIGKWNAELGAELPVSIDNTALQIVPDYRLQANLSLHF